MTSHRKNLTILALLLLLLIGLSLFSLSIGDSRSSLMDVLLTLTGQADGGTQLIILTIRLPRILACLLGGASLALSGLLLQTLTRNPLADSGILGINTGAGMVSAVFISYGLMESPESVYLMPFLAMLGGFATIFVVYLISRNPGGRLSPVRLVITGVGLSTMLSGLMVSIVGNIDRYKVEYMVNWLSGRISGDDWGKLTILGPILLLLWLISASRYQSLNIMGLNEQTALALGLNLQRERLLTLLLATSLAAVSLVLVGNITFVGLIAGHIARRFVTSKHQYSIPAALLIGMILLLAADTAGRVLLVGTGIPTGILVSILGAPYFLYLMYQER